VQPGHTPGPDRPSDRGYAACPKAPAGPARPGSRATPGDHRDSAAAGGCGGRREPPRHGCGNAPSRHSTVRVTFWSRSALMVGRGLGGFFMTNGNLPPGPAPSKRRLWKAGRLRRESTSNEAPPQTGQTCAGAVECPKRLVGLRRSFIGWLSVPHTDTTFRFAGASALDG
jgi:hypothetical protein